MSFSQIGPYLLEGVGELPNVDIAYPGEVWTNQRAAADIVPGSAVIPGAAVNGEKRVRAVATGDTVDQRQVAVAMRQIMVPDRNTGSEYNPALGPNDIVNLTIARSDYVRTYHTGGLHLTLVTPDRNGYEPGELIGWDPEATRPVGKAAGRGAWTHADGVNVVRGTDVFECENWRPFGEDGEGVLTVRYIGRGNN